MKGMGKCNTIGHIKLRGCTMFTIKLIENADDKSRITEKILRKLPNWFGIEEAIVDYIARSRDKVFYAASDGSEEIGFLYLKAHNPFTAELYVIGLLEQYHRQGIGRDLILKAEQYLRANNYRFLMVKTLGESRKNEHYDRTRQFYRSIGFYPLEEFTEIWGEANPCLIMVRNI